MRIRFAVAAMVLSLAAASPSRALERKPLGDIDSNQLISETQVSALCPSQHVNIVWWLPHEFWQLTLHNDKASSEADKERILSTLKPYAVFGVVQADISSFGAFRFYEKDEVAEKLVLSVSGDDGSVQAVRLDQDVDPDLKILLGMFTPTLGAAMGEMGKNFHFYVVKDVGDGGKRLLDPYRTGTLKVQLAMRDGTQLKADIELPLNALYVPRKCPNGKDAHVSWKYCPWTGKNLPL